jgi:hypothetical protein
MDRILQQIFGDEPEQPPAPAASESTAPASASAPTASAATADPTREARRQARAQRKADNEARRQRKEFNDRYMTGEPSEGFSTDEALAYLREMRDEMSPAEFRQAMKQTLEHLPPDQRDEAIAMMQRYKGGAASGATGAQPAAASQAAAAAGAPPANEAMFGNLLDSLMGSGAGTPDAGAIFDDLRRGGLSAPASKSGGKPTEEDFAALLNSPLARAVLGGVAAYGMQNMEADDDRETTRSASA